MCVCVGGCEGCWLSSSIELLPSADPTVSAKHIYQTGFQGQGVCCLWIIRCVCGQSFPCGHWIYCISNSLPSLLPSFVPLLFPPWVFIFSALYILHSNLRCRANSPLSPSQPHTGPRMRLLGRSLCGLSPGSQGSFVWLLWGDSYIYLLTLTLSPDCLSSQPHRSRWTTKLFTSLPFKISDFVQKQTVIVRFVKLWLYCSIYRLEYGRGLITGWLHWSHIQFRIHFKIPLFAIYPWIVLPCPSSLS